MDAAGEAGWGHRAAVAALAVAVVVLLVPAPGLAGGGKGLAPCGEIVKRSPLNKPDEGRPPLVIGDSIVGWKAIPAFRNMGLRTDTQYCRTFGGGLKVLADLRDRKRLPELAIMQVGTGGKLRMKHVKRALRLIGDNRRLGLVTPREFKPGFGESKRRIIRNAAERFDNVVLFDWAAISKGHDEWFHWDNLHPVGKGTTAMAIFFAMIAFDTGDPFATAAAG